MQQNEKEKNSRQRWNEARPTKTLFFWSLVATIVLTMIVGFNWGGWTTDANAQELATSYADDAVVQRLAPICFAQFSEDPDKILKFDELSDMTSYRRAQYVQEQGWATITGVEEPNREVADACTRLILEMSQ